MAQPAAVRPARRLFDAAKDDGGDGYDGLLTELDDLLRGANPKPPPGGIDGTLPGCDSSVNGGPRLAADSQTAGDCHGEGLAALVHVMQEFECGAGDCGDGGSVECEESEQKKFVSGDAPMAAQCSNSHGPDPSLLSTPLPAPVRDPGHSPSGGPLARAAPAPDPPPPSVEAAVACARAVTAATRAAGYAVMHELLVAMTMEMAGSGRPRWEWEALAEEDRPWDVPLTAEEEAAANAYVHPNDPDGYSSEEFWGRQYVEPWDDDYMDEDYSF